MASKYAELHEDDAPVSKYAALHEDDSPAPESKAEDDPNDRVWGIFSRSAAKKLVAENEAKQKQQLESLKALGLGAVRGATLEAAPMISRWTSPKEYADEATAIYDDAEKEHPWATAAGRMAGSLPAMLALSPASSTLAKSGIAAKASPFAAKLLQAGATGLDTAAVTGIQGLLGSKVGENRGNDEFSADNLKGKGYDALSQAILGGAMGAAGSLAPEAAVSAYQLGKQGLGKLAQLPSKASNALAEFLGDAPKPEVAAAEAAIPDNVVPIRPNQEDVPTKVTPLRRLLNDERGAVDFGEKQQRTFKSKKDAFRQIADASGVDDFSKQSREAGHFDEIERLVGRKVKGTEDAFDALVAASAKKRGKSRGTKDWEDVQTAIRELRKIDGLEDLQLPQAVQEAILPVEKEPSFNFGFNQKPPPAKDPEFLRKSQELADMLAEGGDTKISPVDIPRSAHENKIPEQIHQGEKFASELGIDPNSAVGGNIKHKGFYRGQQHIFPSEKPGWLRDPHWWGAGDDSLEHPQGGIMDLLMQDSESPSEQAAMEALNRGERNAARARNPRGDSGAWRLQREAAKEAQGAAEAKAFEGPATGKGGGDLYQPMGARPAPQEPDTQMTSKPDWFDQLERMGIRRPDAPMTDDLFSQISGEVNEQGAAKLDAAPWERSAAKESSPFDDPGVAQQAVSPADDSAIQAARARGREKMVKYAGYAGGIGGAMKLNPVTAWAGAKSAQATMRGAIKGADIAGRIGAGMEQSATKALSPESMAKNMIANPAMLSRIAQSNHPLAGAAKFILDGANEAGEIGMQARAFVAAAMPGMRELFTQGEPSQ